MGALRSIAGGMWADVKAVVGHRKPRVEDLVAA